MRIRPGIFTFLGGLVLLSLGCHAPEKTAAETGVPRVFVSIAPQAFFVEELAGDLVQTEVLAPPDASPATYEVTPRQMERLSRAAAYFRIGVPFERALAPRIEANCPNLRVVRMHQDVALREMGHGGHEHAGHHHGGEDPHVWLDPVRAKQLAENTARVLAEVLPEARQTLQDNLDGLKTRLDNLHQDIKELLAPVRGKTLYVYHPAYGYFAGRFGLRQKAVEHEGKSPNLGNIEAIADAIREEHAGALFVQPQFSTDTAEAVARAAEVELVQLDPLARAYIANLKHMAQQVRNALLPQTQ